MMSASIGVGFDDGRRARWMISPVVAATLPTDRNAALLAGPVAIWGFAPGATTRAIGRNWTGSGVGRSRR